MYINVNNNYNAVRQHKLFNNIKQSNAENNLNNSQSTKSTLSISDIGSITSEYSQKLRGQNEISKTSDINSVFQSNKDLDTRDIEDIITQYGDLLKDIENNYIGEEKESRLKALNTAYADIADRYADKIASKFESVFDYAANKLPANDMKSPTGSGIFDKEVFKNNLKNTLIELKDNYAANLKDFDSDTAMKKAISQVDKKTVTSLETLNYSSIKTLSNIIDKDFNTGGNGFELISNWAKAYDKMINNGNLSEDIKKQLTQAKETNIKAYGKIYSYKEETNYNDKFLKKLNSRNFKLSKILSKIEKMLDSATNMDDKLRLLKRAAGIKTEINENNKKIKEFDEKQKQLKVNPNNIENTDFYKDVISKIQDIINSSVK